MSSKSFIQNLVCKTENKFGGIVFAYKDNINDWWFIAIDNYEIYTSEQYKRWRRNWHCVANKKGITILFCYQNPKEEILQKFAQEDNLFLNI